MKQLLWDKQSLGGGLQCLVKQSTSLNMSTLFFLL
jgi:hypothetical protein